MFARSLVVSGLLVALAQAGADTLHLKDEAAVSGRILAEKDDKVFVDLGFTVLAVPRDFIERTTKGTAGTNAPVLRSAGGDALYQTASGTRVARSVREWVALLGEAVVQIRTPASLGSGFFINADGHLVTNFHVIEGETQISVEVYHQANGRLDRKVYKEVRVVAANKFTDVALLRIQDKDAPRFATLSLGDADALAVGERVFAIGSPLGLERTVTEGIISTTTREFQGDLYLQTSAQINPGNSGGPLFNLAGEVVGVINMKVTSGEGIAFAIPVNTLRYFLDHRDAFAYGNDNPNNPYRYLDPPSRTRLDPQTKP